MKLLKVVFRALIFLFVFYPFCVMAVVIEFPKEELARESVLPIFDNRMAVKSRLVPTKGRVELGLASGFALNEPFFKTLRYGGHLAYHITETHGFLLEGQIYQKGLNRNGNALDGTEFVQDEKDKSKVEHLRIKYAPQPESHFTANYQITAYYGKISVLKNMVMNLSLYGLGGVGMINIGGDSRPVFHLGLGQKFYFNRYWGIRADLGMMIYRGVNYFQGKGGKVSSPLLDAKKQLEVDQFDSTMNYNTRFSLSLILLI